MIMNETAKLPKIERTAEQKAEERRIRELHRQNPVREVPADTIRGADAAQLLKLIALIQREREAQGLTLEQLSERAGMDVATLSRLESGEAFNPGVSTLFRIARALGKNLELAFEGDARTITGS
jgi:ribosome-binding protein aMBF1 (putative translation factor)